MGFRKKPLKRSIFLFILGFITLLCLVLSIMTYHTYNNSIYESYNRRMTDILNYVYSHIEIDDLSECVDSSVESEQFKEMMTFMDSIMEDFDIHFLYIVKPVMDRDPIVMMNIFSADTAEGRATDPDGYYLGLLLDGVYEEKDVITYNEMMQKDEITYFKNFSTWGYDYTAALPLINSEGEHFAVLCVDIQVEDVERAIRSYTIINIILIIILGILFMIIFIVWMNHNVTEPIGQLEKSVVSFAMRSHEQKNPDLLNYEDPHIHSHNEVESLANAVNQMSNDMQLYAKNILDAEGQVQVMRTKVSHMDIVAYQDALTHVKNKAWYDKIEKRIDSDIAKGTARFGIVMVDLNCLKQINDTYGHEHGNDYIFGSCHQICIIFDHSPVFRIGGDEFVILLENRDYDDRENLINTLKVAFTKSSEDQKREPWDRYSAAIGYSIFDAATDKAMNDVFKRADEAMYKDKVASKKARQ